MKRVLAYHLVLTAYGFWLPNDPRGSWSEFVRVWELVRFGKATKTNEKRSLARERHDFALRLAAKKALVREPVKFNGMQARAIARGIGRYCQRSGCVLHALSILPTHVHMVVARHTCLIEQVARLMKGAATTQLLKEGLHPFENQPYTNASLPTPWTRHAWSVFLGDNKDIWRAIHYVRRNPTREGYPAQQWNLITEFVSA